MTEEEHNDKLPQVGEIIASRRQHYEAMKLLGKGGFGAVFHVRRVADDAQFAMKCETYDVKKQVLTMDCKVLRGAYMIRSPHFCTVLDRGKVHERFRFLIMKLNLWELRIATPTMRFSLNTSLKAAEQSLMSIEDLHKVGYLHRDIKPGNFAIGMECNQEQQIIYMLDFGLCRKFLGDQTHKDLRMPRASAPFRGTTRYASLAALRQIEQSRKDDIEAWLYMVVEWTAGQLPWRKLKGSDKEDVLKWKEDVRSGEALDDFLTDCPKRQFTAIMQYLDSLVYQSIPDYDYVYYCIQHACRVNGIDPTEPLDWDPTRLYHGPCRADRDKRGEETSKIPADSAAAGAATKSFTTDNDAAGSKKKKVA
uniref:Protein kinase domain-containing protein n=1 Tax=Panagrellus redivivus TaxID=6233 RepID=A0A7E4UU49_PANRE